MTAATIPKIKAADEPARMDASLDGAEVEAEDGVRVAELWLDVVVMSLKSRVLLVLLAVLLVKVAELNVEFRTDAVPVPRAPVMLVTLAVELPNGVGEAASVDEAALLLLADELAETPLTEKRPE